MRPQPGDLYWAELSDSGEVHPVVIVVSRVELNRGYYVVGVPITSEKFEQRRKLPNYVPFQAGQFNLPKNCVAQCEAISVIEQSKMGPQPFDHLSEEVWRALVRAIGNVICADCVPN